MCPVCQLHKMNHAADRFYFTSGILYLTSDFTFETESLFLCWNYHDETISMNVPDFSLLDDPPSDAPTKRAPQVHQVDRDQRKEQTQKTGKAHSTSGRNSETVEYNEREFIQRLLQRDQRSWDEFLSRYNKLIVSRILAACRECGNSPRPDLVEECGAEVMAVLFQGDLSSLRQFKGRSKLSTWLAVIVRRTTLDVLRRQRKASEKICPNDSQFDIATVPDTLPENALDDPAREHKHLQDCMAQLKDGDRRALELYFDQKLSYAEIGRQLCISENAVGPKLHRAQQRLKKIMQSGKRES